MAVRQSLRYLEAMPTCGRCLAGGNIPGHPTAAGKYAGFLPPAHMSTNLRPGVLNGTLGAESRHFPKALADLPVKVWSDQLIHQKALGCGALPTHAWLRIYWA